MDTRSRLLIALLIVLAAFALALVVSRTPFERLPHLEDEVALLWQARLFAGGHLSLPSPQPSGAYWQPFIVDYNGQRFSKYAPGWPLLLAFGAGLGAPWVVNAWLLALCAALTYRLGRAYGGTVVGVSAAALFVSSPMILLLSGTLMSHVAATFWLLAGLFAGWRLTARPARRWAILAGIAAGMLFNTRPLTALGALLPIGVALALPVIRGTWRLLASVENLRYFARVLRAGPLARRIIWSGVRLWWRGQAWKATLGLWFVAALLITTLLTPLHTYAATGNPTTNLYRLVWDYDRIGFGPEMGRGGHTLQKALINLGFDLNVWASDLFGWQIAQGAQAALVARLGVELPTGISWILPLAGLILARRKRVSWLLAGLFGGLVVVYLFYWAGSGIVYSTRYYSEAVPALALLSGAALHSVAQRFGRRVVWLALAVSVAASLIGYTPDRLALLWRFNDVGQDDIAALEAQRDGRPVLILVSGEGLRSWRDWGTYMALTSPYLDSDVIAARVHNPAETALVVRQHPNRQILELPPDGVLRPFSLP
ncbi:MAG: hypothetical protein Kow0077_00090 [Anaerolineae bacterium]